MSELEKVLIFKDNIDILKQHPNISIALAAQEVDNLANKLKEKEKKQFLH